MPAPRKGRTLRAAPSGTIQRVLQNVGWLFTAKIVGAVLSIVYLAIATRTLGPQGFGQFVLIVGTAQLVGSFVSFETWQAVVRFGMPHAGQGSSPVVNRLIAFSTLLDIGGALVGCVLVTAGILLLGPRFGWSSDLQLAALLFSYVLLLSIRSTPTGILRLHDQFAKGAAADASTSITRFIGALIVFATGPTVTKFLIVWAASEVVTAIAYWLLARRAGGWSLRGVKVRDIRGVPGEHKGIWPFVVVSNLSFTLAIASKHLTLLLVGLAVGPAGAGLYRLAHQLGQSVALVAEMISRALFSELARAGMANGAGQVRTLFRNSLRLGVGAGGVIIVLVLALGRPLLGLVAGEEFAAAYPLLLLLGTAAALELAAVSFEPALLTTGHTGTALKLRLAATAFLFLMIAALLPAMGTTGAALATLSAQVFALLLFGLVTWRAIHR